MSDEERRLDEIEALKWIFPQELTLFTESTPSGIFKISPNLIEDEITLKIITVGGENSEEEEKVRVNYLPPIELYFMCPLDYPSKSQPLFMLACDWLAPHEITRLCHELDRLWDDGYNSEILFSWVSFIKEDSCSFLKLHELKLVSNMDQIGRKPLKIDGYDDTENISNVIHVMNRRNLILKELENKSVNKKTIPKMNKSRNKKYRNAKRHFKSSDGRDCFKYETPKDLEKKSEAEKQTNVSAESSTSVNDEGDAEKQVPMARTSYIIKSLPTYGKREKISVKEFDTRVIPKVDDTPTIVNRITDYNEKRLDMEFRCQSHSCNICFEEKPGSQCVSIKPCRHAFCKDCVRDYLTINIENSQVQKLRCLDPSCETILKSYQIRQNVDKAVYEKYLKFSSKMMVQTDSLLMYCPRDFCQGVARITDASKDMCYCRQCNYYFCSFCKRAYHGVEICKIKSDEIREVIEEYQTASDARKMELERRFTKSQLLKWVQDDLTEKLIKRSSKPCPNCGALIEKDHGCNKMLCVSCNMPFCWLCNTLLSSVMPYAHYQSRESPCFEKLFPRNSEEEEEEEEFWDDEYLEDVYVDEDEFIEFLIFDD